MLSSQKRGLSSPKNCDAVPVLTRLGFGFLPEEWYYSVRGALRLNLNIAVIGILATLACTSGALAETALERGDAAWKKKTELVIETGELDPKQLNMAMESYEQALLQDPTNLTIHVKLMDTLYYMGFFIAKTKAQKKPYADRAIELNQSALQILADRVGREKMAKASTPAAQAKLLRQEPEAASVHLWCGINWGLFARAHGNLAGARHNVARKIRNHAQMVVLLDDQYWDGGGYRLLGRLHTDAPIVPGFTGWVRRSYGIEMSRRDNAISTEDTRNPIFLAQALLNYQPESADEALELLEELSQRQPGENRPFEDAHYIKQAKIILDEERRRRAK
jgi:hypothetical protein